MEEAKGLQSIMLNWHGILDGRSWKVTHVKNVIDAMTVMLAHFNFSDQLIGFLGSSGPSQSTIIGSTAVVSVSGSFLSKSSL